MFKSASSCVQIIQHAALPAVLSICLVQRRQLSDMEEV